LKTLRKLVVLVFITFLMMFSFAMDIFAQGDAGEKVSSVEVQLNISGDIYQGLQERIEYSINRVGEKLLISQPVSLLETNKDTVQQTIWNVVSKVLTGFRTEAVEVFLGEHTKIIIQLTPLPPFITGIDLDGHLNNISAEMAGFADKAVVKVETELNKIFIGLPVEATPWADNIFSLVINYLVERELPGFTPAFSIIPGTETKIKLVLSPMEPMVSEINIDYSSTNLPVWLVRAKIKDYQKKFGIIKGTPVEFLTHYKPQIEQYFTDYFSDLPGLNQAGLVVKTKLNPGTKSNVELEIDSLYLSTKLEARYFRGEKDSFSNLQGYLGYRLGNGELYTRLYLGENPDGLTKIGFKFPISTNFYGGFEYETESYYKNICFAYRFERGDYLELNLGLDGSPNKALIGINMNSKFNLEIVKYDNEYGLQLMVSIW
jgi:hypothetical protein